MVMRVFARVGVGSQVSAWSDNLIQSSSGRGKDGYGRQLKGRHHGCVISIVPIMQAMALKHTLAYHLQIDPSIVDLEIVLSAAFGGLWEHTIFWKESE